jgi:hypothetical protein
MAGMVFLEETGQLQHDCFEPTISSWILRLAPQDNILRTYLLPLTFRQTK